MSRLSTRTLQLICVALGSGCAVLAIAVVIAVLNKSSPTSVHVTAGDGRTENAIEILAAEMLEERRQRAAEKRAEETYEFLERFVVAAVKEEYLMGTDIMEVNGRRVPFTGFARRYFTLSEDDRRLALALVYAYWTMQEESFDAKDPWDRLFILDHDQVTPKGYYRPDEGFIEFPVSPSQPDVPPGDRGT